MPPATTEPSDREREMMKVLSDIEAQEWRDKIEEGRKTKIAQPGTGGVLDVPKFREPSQQEIDDFNNEVPVKPAGPSAGAGDSRTPSEILEDQRWEEGKAARAAARTPAGPGAGSIGQPGSTADEAADKNSEKIEELNESIDKLITALDRNSQSKGGEGGAVSGKGPKQPGPSGPIAEGAVSSQFNPGRDLGGSPGTGGVPAIAEIAEAAAGLL